MCTIGSGSFMCYDDYDSDTKTGNYCGKATDYYGTGTTCASEKKCGKDGVLTTWTQSGLTATGCSYENLDLFCQFNGACYIGELGCGTGCEIDGSECTTGACRCSDGYEPVYSGYNTFECQQISDLSCTEDGVCSFGSKQCGTGCQEDGTNCSTGTCIADECTDETTLTRVNNQYYGCYSETNGTKCYKYGTAYVRYKNGVECGTGCKIDGSNCSAPQTCVSEETEE